MVTPPPPGSDAAPDTGAERPPLPRATIRLGTRGSALARAQAERVRDLLLAAWPGLSVEVVIISTSGDRDLQTPLHNFGGTGVFVKELESALLANEVDLAVHSMKDLPTLQPDGLVVRAIDERADPRDVLVRREGANTADGTGSGIHALADGAVVGTSSIRRIAALQALRDGLTIKGVRGNVNTRLAKLDAGEYDALVMARAGLERLGFGDRISHTFGLDELPPAPGQGILGAEWRADDDGTAQLVAALVDPAVEASATAERAFLRTAEAGCHAPVGATLITADSLADQWTPVPTGYRGAVALCGFVASTDGGMVFTGNAPGELADAAQLGEQLAHRLLDAGAADVLAALRDDGGTEGTGNGGNG